jgi:hypothetical protein
MSDIRGTRNIFERTDEPKRRSSSDETMRRVSKGNFNRIVELTSDETSPPNLWRGK